MDKGLVRPCYTANSYKLITAKNKDYNCDVEVLANVEGLNFDILVIKEKKPSWKIYCIGTTTQQLVVKYFGQDAVIGTANDAAALAKLIVEEQPKGKRKII